MPGRSAARLDDYADASGQAADLVRKLGVRASIGVPIIVEGRLWGAIFVGSTREPLPCEVVPDPAQVQVPALRAPVGECQPGGLSPMPG
jgi:GAF domain-containing protein